jgi:hypothetical protein
MPITRQLNVARRSMTFTVSGTVTTGEMLAAVDDAMRDTEQAPYAILSDHRSLDEPATTPQVKALVSHLTDVSAHFAGSRWAIVTGLTASYGMMRMLSVLAAELPIEIAVFTDLVEATCWLSAGAPVT